MDDGIKLKRYGHFQVWRDRREAPSYAVSDARTGEDILIASVLESADFAADRLASGRPLETPAEMMDRMVSVWPTNSPTRFRYYDRAYLVGGSWLMGGLLGYEDVTSMTAEGRAWIAAKAAADHARTREGLEGLPDVLAAEEEEIQLSYVEGCWPDADVPPPVGARWANRFVWVTDPCPLRLLAESTINPPVTEEWLEDARVGTRLLLQYGINDPDRPDERHAENLRTWATALAAKYGGMWTP